MAFIDVIKTGLWAIFNAIVAPVSISTTSSSSMIKRPGKLWSLVAGVLYMFIELWIFLVLLPLLYVSSWMCDLLNTYIENNFMKSLTAYHFLLWKLIPGRLGSYLFGIHASKQLAPWARGPFYMSFAKAFNIDLNDQAKPIESYESLADFFCRPLKEGCRPISPYGTIISPVDGTLVACGEIPTTCEPWEIMKGCKTTLAAFIGSTLVATDICEKASVKGKKLVYATFYLGVNDYHRVHSPFDWTLKRQYHHPGCLFPLAIHGWLERLTRGVLTYNERVVLTGSFERADETTNSPLHSSNMSDIAFMALIGAFNVGSIRLNHTSNLVTSSFNNEHTNVSEHLFNDKGISLTRGSELGRFECGSCVVLAAVVPEHVGFNVKLFDRVRVGQPII